MNLNANMSTKQPLGRKMKRVSDHNAMGYNPYTPQNTSFLDNSAVNQSQPDFMTSTPQGMYNPNPAMPAPNQVPVTNYNYNMPYNPVGGDSIFGQPMVQNMAMHYTQQMATTGVENMKKEVEKYVPVTQLKYYFAVDTKYVLKKLALLFFPFTHSDWSIKFERDGPVQPRFEINAPDLYIPTMAYVTYVLVAGLVLGMQNRFSPEQIGIQSSSALAWCLVELAIYSCTLYIANITTSLRTLDLLAYSGYKFVGIIVSILMSVVGGPTAYYLGLIYTSFALAFFLVRSLRSQVLTATQNYGAQDQVYVYVGNKRRWYFLLFVACWQPVFSWWLSFHLVRINIPVTASPVVNAL